MPVVSNSYLPKAHSHEVCMYTGGAHSFLIVVKPYVVEDICSLFVKNKIFQVHNMMTTNASERKHNQDT